MLDLPVPVLMFLFLALIILLTAGVAAAATGFVALCARVWRLLLPIMTAPVPGNRILFWPIALAVVWPLLFALLWLLYAMFWSPIFSDMLFMLIGGGLATLWAATAVVTVKLMKHWIAARYWRTILSSLILPLSFFLAVLSSPFLLKENYDAVDDVNFFAHYRYFLADVEKHSAAEPRFMVWTIDFTYDNAGVLYDETDEIAFDHPSEGWKKRAENEGVICCRHRHIIGHFYLVEVGPPADDVRHDVLRGYDLYKSGRIAPRH